MSILITGGAGYIGSHTAWECVDHGEDVVVLDNLTTGFRWAVPQQAELIVGDIADQTLVEDIIRTRNVDTIIHFAGSVVVPDSFKDPLGYYSNNTAKTRALVESAVRTGVDQFIFSSTAAVYAPIEGLEPVDETAKLEPASPYGSSKLMSETMIRDVALAHDFRYVMLRYFNVAGADPQGRTGLSTKGATHVMKLACEAASGKRPWFEIFGTDYDTPDGTALRDFIHVSDLANAHYVAVKFLRAGGRKFTGNAGYSVGTSVQQVVDAVKRVSGDNFETRTGNRRHGDVPVMVADARRMMHRLDWQPKYNDLDRIVTDALAWEDRLLELKNNAPSLVPDIGNEPNATRLSDNRPLGPVTDKITLI